MQEELVSVVITSYKRERRYIEEALNSALFQTYKNIEIIVVDDNGADNDFSVQLRELCGEKSVKYIKNEKNSGAQFSRNQGILNSKGSFVAFLDDDDIWMNDKIEKQMAYFTDDSIGMVYCDGYSFEDGNMDHMWEFRDASIYDRPISLRLELFNDYIGSTSQAIIRRECFDKVGMFDIDMPARQDYEMWIRITKEYRAVGCPDRLLLYRVHKGERISTSYEKCVRSYKLLLDKHKEEYSKLPYAKAKVVLRIFDWYKKGKKYGLAIKYFLYAFIISPSCVVGVIDRNMRKIPFSEYYKDVEKKL